jgi:GNAT superfamily N-acetyltransferase
MKSSGGSRPGRSSKARRSSAPSARASPPRARGLRFAALTPERWADLEQLFGANGACGGCWCMWWRLGHAEFKQKKGAPNRRAFRRLVESGAVPGILAYAGNDPVGWCAVEPRAAYPRFAVSRNLKPVDDQPVWSVTCFFVARPFRRQGITVQLLEAAKKHARKHGGRILEGYPIEPGGGTVPAAFAWTGFVPAFRSAGFVELLRRSPRQPIVRCAL